LYGFFVRVETGQGEQLKALLGELGHLALLTWKRVGPAAGCHFQEESPLSGLPDGACG
jgi:hypothetical protein